MCDVFVWAGLIGLFAGCALACCAGGALYAKCRCKGCRENDQNGRGAL